jgi:hypothetical protein
MFFPLPVYIIVLGLGWFAWRRRWKLDRKEVLFWYILSVCVTGVGVLIALIPSQEWSSDYGSRILSLTVFIVAIAVASGVLFYFFWPTAKKPTVSIFDAAVHIEPLQIRYKDSVTTLSARLLIVKVGVTKIAALKLRVQGTTTPKMHEDRLVPFGWLTQYRRFINEIRVSVPPTENDAIIEIHQNIRENILQDEYDLPPGISQPVIIGISVEGSATLCFGGSLIELPYEGRILVSALNVPYGILADKWFKISATSWDKIEFTPES